jgi:hypothetical protein
MAYLEFETPTGLWSSTEREILVARMSVLGFEGFAEDEEWEKKFDPVIIKEKVLIRAPFHDSDTDPCTLIIEPKMEVRFGDAGSLEDMEFVLNAAYQCSLDHLQTDEVSNWISLFFKKT